MAQATEIVSVGDRLHAINSTVNGWTANRYWPTNYANTALHPLVVPLPTRRTTAQSPRAGAELAQVTRLWNIIVITGTMMGGIPSETAQRNSEAALEILNDLYFSNPKLALLGGDDEESTDTLGIVIKAEALDDSGIAPYPQNTDLAAVILPLLVTTRRLVPNILRS